MSLDTLTAMRRALETGETTAAALTEKALAAAAADRDLNAFLHIDPAHARAAAGGGGRPTAGWKGFRINGYPHGCERYFLQRG